MAINRNHFFHHARLHLFDGMLKQPQVTGLTAILDKWEGEGGGDERWLAYMLGTAHHGTGRTMQPVRETFAATDDLAIDRLQKAFLAGKLQWVSKPYWNRDGDGKCWLGRGFVQITHKVNYEKMAKATGVDLVGDPDRAMQLGPALQIMFVGMRNGSFSGKKLSDFFHGGTEKWRDARRIINGVEKADLVASYAKHYYAAISHVS